MLQHGVAWLPEPESLWEPELQRGVAWLWEPELQRGVAWLWEPELQRGVVWLSEPQLPWALAGCPV